MGKMMRVTVVFVAAIMMATQAFATEGKPGKVKISYMTRVESHSSVPDRFSGTAAANYSGETFLYNNISVFRELQKGTFGSLFYLNRYSLDDSQVLSNIAGATIIHMFSKRLTGTFGYTYSSDPGRGVLNNDTQNKDRVSMSAIYNPSAGKKHGPMFSYTTSYSAVTDWNEQSSVSEKVNVKFPNIGQKVEADVEYSYSYSLKQEEQLTNQYTLNLAYKLSKTTKLTTSVLFVNNVYTGAVDDDSVLRFTINRNIQ